MANSHLQLITPTNEKPTVVSPNPAGRKKNDQYRDREHLLPSEVEVLIAGAKDGRWGFGDATMIRLAYRHGLRAKEVVELPWAQINLDEAMTSIKRATTASQEIIRFTAMTFAHCVGFAGNIRTVRGYSSMSGVIRSRLTDAAPVRRAGERAKNAAQTSPAHAAPRLRL
jgi:integrase